VKLSLMIPTFNSADTIERTLRSALSQHHRPLELIVYDEASDDGTRAIVERLLAGAPDGIEARLMTSESNSGPVRAWRVPLHAIGGDWCCFVWADDVLEEDFSTRMMAAADRAVAAGRKLVSCSAIVETGDETLDIFGHDRGIASAVEFSEGMFLRRFPLTQICRLYETQAAREVFERHVEIENQLGFDYTRHAYGNDVGFLSELAMAGEGVELLGDQLVRLVDSPRSMTRLGGRNHLWQMRWQYTFGFHRVWGWWKERGVPGADRLSAMADRRLALCSIMLGTPSGRWSVRNVAKAVGAYVDFRRWDYQKKGRSLDEHRRALTKQLPDSVHQDPPS
jgi:glycosyltransferase involved in cell wall biosynthesis